MGNFFTAGAPSIATVENAQHQLNAQDPLVVFSLDGGALYRAQELVVETNGSAVIAAGDLNGDGTDDVAFIAQLSNTVFTYLGGPEGLSPSSSATFIGENLHRLLIHDIDGDGRADIALSGAAAILFQNSDGGFTADYLTRPDAGPDALFVPGDVALGAFDESSPPAVVESFDWSTMRPVPPPPVRFVQSVFEPTGLRNYRSQTFPLALPRYFGAMAVGDLDGDGHLDIVEPSLQIFWGDGAGNFPQSETLDFGRDCQDLIAADLGSDGQATLVFLEGTPARLGLARLNQRDGGLAFGFLGAELDGGPQQFRQNLAIGDVNGDGAPDAVESDDGALTVWLNQCPSN